MITALAACLACAAAPGDPATVRIDPAAVRHRLTGTMTGLCLEDVNHEVYGGLWTQMVFGELFQEPAPTAITGFRAFGGDWSPEEGVLHASASPGGKLVAEGVARATAVSVQVRLTGRGAGNAGVLVGLADPALGADAFHGYEVSLDTDGGQGRGSLRLARHDGDYRLIRDVPCTVRWNTWARLEAAIEGHRLTISVDGRVITTHEADDVAPGGVALRTWQRAAEFQALAITDDGRPAPRPFAATGDPRVSGLWKAFARGGAEVGASLTKELIVLGQQAQVVRYAGREGGEAGIENRGLNRAGMAVTAGREYRGRFRARVDREATLRVNLASADGSRRYASAEVPVTSGTWADHDFSLTPTTSDDTARLELCLTAPGEVTFAYASLEPGDWGRFKGLAVRRDVADAMLDLKPGVIRYGGSMVNAGEYLWGTMVRRPDLREPYTGTWYPHASNGWAIPEFLAFASAAGVLAVPTLNINETPAELGSFVEFVNGDASTPWGSKRAALGRREPFRVTHLELGNEERVDAAFARKFERAARAIWARDPGLILTVGDFAYTKPIRDPDHVEGADSGITTLEGQRMILDLARELKTEVWFDIHIWSEKPDLSGSEPAWKTYIDRIDELAQGVRHRVVVYELNANTHTHERALANAQTLMRLQADGRVPVVATANALQVDGHNDNGWDQGLIFIAGRRVWAQPPAHAWRMISTGVEPLVVRAEVAGGPGVEALASVSEDGTVVSVELLNLTASPRRAAIAIAGWDPAAEATATTLSADLGAVNTKDAPDRVAPRPLAAGPQLELPPWSFTLARYRKR